MIKRAFIIILVKVVWPLEMVKIYENVYLHIMTVSNVKFTVENDGCIYFWWKYTVLSKNLEFWTQVYMKNSLLV